MGHDVTVSNCALLVNLAFPWLSASLNRILYHPAESSYGVVEMKCPHSLPNKKVDELARSTEWCRVQGGGKDGQGEVEEDAQFELEEVEG